MCVSVLIVCLENKHGQSYLLLKVIVTTTFQWLFAQDDHHHTQVKPTHDAPIGSRTPAATGEDDPRKEWKVLVTFSMTPVPMEHSSDLRAN